MAHEREGPQGLHTFEEYTEGVQQGGTPYVSPGAQEHVDAFLAVTGIVDATIESALLALVTGMQSSGLWSKMEVIYPMVGGTADTHKFNLKNPADTDGAYRIIWNGTVTHDANGVTGNGTTGYGNTQFIWSALPALLNNGHVSAYSRTNSAVNLQTAMGASSGLVRINMSPRVVAGNMQVNFQSSGFFNRAVPDSLGMFIINRRTSTHARTVKSGSAVENALPSTDLPTVPMFILGSNLNGVLDSPTVRNFAWFSAGYGLTDQNETDLNTLVQAFQTTLLRNV